MRNYEHELPHSLSEEKRQELQQRLAGLSIDHERRCEVKLIEVDGRLVEARRFGYAHQYPIFMLHGSPGHANDPIPRNLILHLLGVNIISYSRPGYGVSDRHEGRQVADEATRIEAIADAYGIDQFSVIGRSGGGPSALAVAHLLPDRIRSVAVLAGPAPRASEPVADWTTGMSDLNRQLHSHAITDRQQLAEAIYTLAEETRANPRHLLDFLRPHFSDSDHTTTDNGLFVPYLLQSYRNALSHGPYGWIDDVLALHEDWGFTLQETTMPTLLWYAEKDPFTPPDHGTRLQEAVPNAEFVITPNKSHFESFELIQNAIAWCRERASSLP
ncbi:alpha/beta hydrolase [Streptomyces caniscabiei]|uniref:alpha/beta fold hydrolase n=1 Tax=Streptomyces caniscabiei TaxID=2746961 RepID=UPI0029BD8FBC|nr:alpha/beta hydrolase [Streptomyces caniscabiei]MDX2776489.1 alpha/beta hydrolase [Streptomyces caniscabiei]